MMPTAVRNPSPGTTRPRIRSYIGVNTSSILLQKIQRSHAVRKAGTVTKKPAMNRTLSQFLTPRDIVNSRIAPRASRHGRERARMVARDRARGEDRAALGRRDAAAAHHAQELAEAGEAQEGIAALLVANRRGRGAVIVSGKQDRGIGQRAETLRERVVHLLRIASGQVGPAARADEERVAGHEPAVDQEAL